jgi:uncharacterized protein YjiS (DUF1127 family)
MTVTYLTATQGHASKSAGASVSTNALRSTALMALRWLLRDRSPPEWCALNDRLLLDIGRSRVEAEIALAHHFKCSAFTLERRPFESQAMSSSRL